MPAAPSSSHRKGVGHENKELQYNLPRCRSARAFEPDPTSTRSGSVGSATSAGANPQISVRLDFEAHAPAFYRAMVELDRAATKQLDDVGFDPGLRELVRIRASQLNGCAYCIDMHTKDARALGESEQRIYALAAWRDAPFFSDRERAALAFTETVTLLAERQVPDPDYDAVAAHFGPDEIAALISLIATINAWNALAVSTRAWAPGSHRA
jgi:AhpD family alkylhydroperoxidase